MAYLYCERGRGKFITVCWRHIEACSAHCADRYECKDYMRFMDGFLKVLCAPDICYICPIANGCALRLNPLR